MTVAASTSILIKIKKKKEKKPETGGKEFISMGKKREVTDRYEDIELSQFQNNGNLATIQELPNQNSQFPTYQQTGYPIVTYPKSQRKKKLF